MLRKAKEKNTANIEMREWEGVFRDKRRKVKAGSANNVKVNLFFARPHWPQGAKTGPFSHFTQPTISQMKLEQIPRIYRQYSLQESYKRLKVLSSEF